MIKTNKFTLIPSIRTGATQTLEQYKKMQQMNNMANRGWGMSPQQRYESDVAPWTPNKVNAAVRNVVPPGYVRDSTGKLYAQTIRNTAGGIQQTPLNPHFGNADIPRYQQVPSSGPIAQSAQQQYQNALIKQIESGEFDNKAMIASGVKKPLMGSDPITWSPVKTPVAPVAPAGQPSQQVQQVQAQNPAYEYNRQYFDTPKPSGYNANVEAEYNNYMQWLDSIGGINSLAGNPSLYQDALLRKTAYESALRSESQRINNATNTAIGNAEYMQSVRNIASGNGYSRGGGSGGMSGSTRSGMIDEALKKSIEKINEYFAAQGTFGGAEHIKAIEEARRQAGLASTGGAYKNPFLYFG